MRYLALILLVLTAASLSSCGGCQCGKKSGDAAASGGAGAAIVADASPGADHSSGNAPQKAPGDSLKVEVDLTERGYALPEPVVITLRVTNIKEEDLTLTFPTAQRYDFIVKKGKQIVWVWSEGRMFAQAIGRETLKTGETFSYEVIWDQSGLESIQPPLGTYTVHGILKTTLEIASEEREFGIVD